MEIDNPTDSNVNTINSSNEFLNSTSPYSNTTFNQSSVMGTPGSLGSTIISDIVNETNKYVTNAESSVAVDTPMSTTNNSISLTTTSSLNNTSTISSIVTGTNTNIDTPSSLNTSSFTSLNSTNITTDASTTTKTSTSSNATPKPSTSIPAATASTTVAPIAPIPTVTPFVTPNPLTALAGLNINSLALTAAANSLKATDHTNYDINLQPSVDGLNNVSTLNTNSPTTDVPTAPFLFNPSTPANLFNSTTLSSNTKTINSLPVVLTNTNAMASVAANKSIPNVFSKAKQNDILSTIKKKESLLHHPPLSSSQISSFIQSSVASSLNSTTSMNTIPRNSNTLINPSLLTMMNINTTESKEGKEIKEIKERANYNFNFTSRHTAYQYIHLLRSEKIL